MKSTKEILNDLNNQVDYIDKYVYPKAMAGKMPIKKVIHYSHWYDKIISKLQTLEEEIENG